jgi:hypothetical protein
MHKMYFNTGVRPENMLDKNGKLILMDHQEIKGGVMQIAYYLEREPEKDLTLSFLVPSNYLEHMKPYEVAIKIVGGGTLSDYAIFIKSNQ